MRAQAQLWDPCDGGSLVNLVGALSPSREVYAAVWILRSHNRARRLGRRETSRAGRLSFLETTAFHSCQSQPIDKNLFHPRLPCQTLNSRMSVSDSMQGISMTRIRATAERTNRYPDPHAVPFTSWPGLRPSFRPNSRCAKRNADARCWASGSFSSNRKPRPAEWASGSVCTAEILSRVCRLGVKSGPRATSALSPVYPQLRT